MNQVFGSEEIITNLQKWTAKEAAACQRAIKLCGLALQRASQLLAPVDYGPLKASAFTRATGGGFSTSAIVGYTAAYALFVHERVDMKWKGLPRQSPHKGRYWDPQGRAQAKFLEQPARTMGPDFLKIMKKEMAI